MRPDVEPILLSNDEPAPRQMARAVQGRRGLEAIHVIAHGRPGEVAFSAGVLSVENIDRHVADLVVIGSVIGQGGELRLWSCGVTQGERGTAFEETARASGANVAAAAGLVGGVTRGGCRDLSARSVPASVVAASAATLVVAGCNDKVPTVTARIASPSPGTGALVNGTSIIRETNVPEVFIYYHVEVDDHSLIVAENTPAETLVDNVDRLNFDELGRAIAVPAREVASPGACEHSRDAWCPSAGNGCYQKLSCRLTADKRS